MLCWPSLREGLSTGAKLSHCSCTGVHGDTVLSTAATKLQGHGFDSSNFGKFKNKRRKLGSKQYVDGERDNGLFVAQPNSEPSRVASNERCKREREERV